MSFRGAKFNHIPTADHAAAAYRYNPNPNYTTYDHPAQAQPFLTTVTQQLDKYSKKVDQLLDLPAFQKAKPHVPQIGRFLIVATFYEDSFRIISQWSEQVYYLWNYRHIPYFLVIISLILVVLTMLISSTLIVIKKHALYASVGLISVIFIQGLMYGLFVGSNFVLRNFSLIGGLLIAFSDSIVKKKQRFAGLPDITGGKNTLVKNYILLAGRILLVLLFFTFAATKSWLTTIITSIGIFAIAFGYKTRFASVLLITILIFYNFSQNSYWGYGISSSKRDYLKYEFFQTLSIIGGLLLVVNTGAGELSLDEKKKDY